MSARSSCGRCDVHDDQLETLMDLPSRVLVGDIAVLNIIDCVRANRREVDDPEMALYEARYAVRAIGAILPPGGDDALTVAKIAGFIGMRANDFFSALAAVGPYSGEMGVEKLRGFLTQVVAFGQHPLELADSINLDPVEYEELNHLLEMEEHWEATVGDRVLLAVASGASIEEIQRLARCGYWAARRWRKWAIDTVIELGLE